MDNFFSPNFQKSKIKISKSKLESLEPFIRSFYSDASEDDLRGTVILASFFAPTKYGSSDSFANPGKAWLGL